MISATRQAQLLMVEDQQQEIMESDLWQVEPVEIRDKCAPKLTFTKARICLKATNNNQKKTNKNSNK